MKNYEKPKTFKSKNFKEKDRFNYKKKVGINYKEEIDISNCEIIVWIYSESKNNNYWFIDIEGQEKWYFVYPKNILDAMSWDQVEAYVKVFKWRKEAVITKIIKRDDRTLVWTLQLNKWFAFVVLDNLSFKKDVYISKDKLKKINIPVNHLDKVAVKISKWDGKNPEWYIVEVLWKVWEKWVDILSIALEAGARIKFGEGILAEANNLKQVIWVDRINLTTDFIFTIDWEDAKDLDDAISIEKNWDKYKLWVHIADVSEYIKEWGLIDKEAFKRGNSIYLVNKVIPMLPEKLSNELCSLNTWSTKLTLTCEIILDNNWNIFSKKVYESFIKTSFRLTYSDVQKIIDWDLKVWDEMFAWQKVTWELIEKIKLAKELKDLVSKRKKDIWVLDFNFWQTKIEVDENWNTTDIKKYPIYESNKIIEEFMILANESVSQMFSNIPFLYRIHPLPTDEDIEKLRNILNIFGIILPYKTITSISLSKVLEEIKKSKKEKLLSKLLLRSLSKAVYSDINEWHFGLWLSFYSHFTSPIRRYPDLIIHRIIKEKLAKKLDNNRIKYYTETLTSIAKHTSQTERTREKLEYAIKDLFICKYYTDKIWMEFEWTISWTIPAWFFVELENTAEWFVSIEQVLQETENKKFDYDEEKMTFLITKDFNLSIWDTIKIKISSIDMDRRRLNFDYISK